MKSLISRIRSINWAPWLSIFFAVGVAGLSLPFSRDLFQQLIPLTLLMNLGLLFIFHGKMDNGFWWKVLVVYLFGFFIEMIGTNTGLVFGEYTYGPSLGPKVFHTPLMIGVNWVMLVYASLVIMSKYFERRYFRVLMAAVLMVVYDFALEPSAIAFDMWNWGGPVPLQNYVAWLVISFILIWFADYTRMVNYNNKLAPVLFYVQFVFFILLDIILIITKIWES
jgi:putative membrane protein